MTTPNELDEQYILDAQDPNEPVWETDANIADMQEVGDALASPLSGDWNDTTPVIRTASGALEFLNDVEETAHKFFEEDVQPVKQRNKLDPIRTRELGADSWRAGRRQVVAGMSGPIIVQSSYRRRITLINWGPNPVWLSSKASAGGAPNTIQLPVSGAAFWAPLVLQIKDEVWANCAATQTASVDIIEEFDLES